MNPAQPTLPPSSDLRKSWERSRAHGLTPDAPLPDAPVVRADLADRLEDNARLLTFSRAAIENLHQQIGSASSTVLLADRHGLILSTVGAADFLDRAARVALNPGAQWREADVGTNAIGTALHTGTVVTVRGDEHYLDRNRFLTCVATPILAPSGGIVGILDISTDARADLSHATALLRTTAELIEHQLIVSLDNGFLSVHFHSHPELIGGPLEALVVFDEDARLLASNRAARRLLGLDEQHPTAQCHECFLTSWSGLIGWAALRQGTPFPVRTVRGRTFPARARLQAAQGTSVSCRQSAPHSTTGGAAPDTTKPAAHRSSQLLAMQLGDAGIDVVIDTLRRYAPESSPLLIAGETGSGKTHLLRAFHHDTRSRPDAPLTTLDCTTLPPDAESAANTVLTALRQSTGGHLVLRDIGALKPALQARLWAAAGADGARLIATTSRPLAELVRNEQFDIRAFEAHGGHAICLPALRERSDFDALVRCFIRENLPNRPIYVCPDALELLRRHHWPGNLSELRALLRLILVLMGDDASQLCPEDIPDDFLDESGPPPHC